MVGSKRSVEVRGQWNRERGQWEGRGRIMERKEEERSMGGGEIDGRRKRDGGKRTVGKKEENSWKQYEDGLR